MKPQRKTGSFDYENTGIAQWTVRDQRSNRVGVVLGANGKYSAQSMRGELIGHANSRQKAASLLMNPC